MDSLHWIDPALQQTLVDMLTKLGYSSEEQQRWFKSFLTHWIATSLPLLNDTFSSYELNFDPNASAEDIQTHFKQLLADKPELANSVKSNLQQTFQDTLTKWLETTITTE